MSRYRFSANAFIGILGQICEWAHGKVWGMFDVMDYSKTWLYIRTWPATLLSDFGKVFSELGAIECLKNKNFRNHMSEEIRIHPVIVTRIALEISTRFVFKILTWKQKSFFLNMPPKITTEFSPNFEISWDSPQLGIYFKEFWESDTAHKSIAVLYGFLNQHIFHRKTFVLIYTLQYFHNVFENIEGKLSHIEKGISISSVRDRP